MENVKWEKHTRYKPKVGGDKMQYECTIRNIVEDEEVTVQIGDIQIIGFVNCGCNNKIGDVCSIDISLYDDLEIDELANEECSVNRKDNSYGYELKGILDIDNHRLKSVIDFDIDEEILMNYGYLDGRYVSINVLRIDFEFV